MATVTPAPTVGRLSAAFGRFGSPRFEVCVVGLRRRLNRQRDRHCRAFTGSDGSRTRDLRSD